jgi:integrase
LALLWRDVDLDNDVIHISRMQEQDGTTTNFTKTASSTRDIPVSPILKGMLLRWRNACPSEERVFPCLGSKRFAKHKKRGSALSYTNFSKGYWRPVFAALALPYVTPHSARHAFISTLQAQGIEVGLVAKLAGHSNATVTLTHYTQAVRGGATALRALEEAYGSDRLQAQSDFGRPLAIIDPRPPPPRLPS